MKMNFITKTIAIAAIGFSAIAAPAFAASYEIKQGDTFWKLSQAHKISLESVLRVNPGIDPLNLQPGQIVRLPDVKSIANTTKQEQSVALKPAQATTATPDKNKTIKTASGETLTYKHQITAKASAYSAAPEENGIWGAVDYFGNPLQLGTIAVDPAVIPLGTTLYITGYAFDGLPKVGLLGKALDMGGAVKGEHVDIFIPGSSQKVRKFGLQNVKVYIIDN